MGAVHVSPAAHERVHEGRNQLRQGHRDRQRRECSAERRRGYAWWGNWSLKALAADKPVALMCFEADHAGCHRAVLAERLAEETGVAVVDL